MIFRFALSLVSAAVLVLALPHFDWIYLAPVALAPLLWAALREPRPWPRFLLGYAAGIVYWFGVCYWIQATLAEHGGMSVFTSWLLFGLFCLAKAVQMGLFTYAIRFCRDAVSIAGLWTFLEWTHNYTGFAWLVLGNAAVDWPWLAKLAPWTGVWGISFLLALVSATLVRPGKWPLAAVALFALVLFFLPQTAPTQPGQHAAWAVQPNIADDAAWPEAAVVSLRHHLASLSQPPQPVDLVVWPEVPAPLYDSDPILPQIARTTQTRLLAGVVGHTERGEPLNSALLISPEGRFISRYDKVNLVPFGEFVPWPFDAVTRKISTEAGDFHRGRDIVVADRIGVFICYESVFPNYIRRFAQAGAQVLFNLSNDSWFGTSHARYQHFSIVRMRAAENHRWIVRVTNNGITASIDPAGVATEFAPPFREAVQTLHYNYETASTWYTRGGDWWIVLCLILFAAPLLFRVYGQFREHGTSPVVNR